MRGTARSRATAGEHRDVAGPGPAQSRATGPAPRDELAERPGAGSGVARPDEVRPSGATRPRPGRAGAPPAPPETVAGLPHGHGTWSPGLPPRGGAAGPLSGHASLRPPRGATGERDRLPGKEGGFRAGTHHRVREARDRIRAESREAGPWAAGTIVDFASSPDPQRSAVTRPVGSATPAGPIIHESRPTRVQPHPHLRPPRHRAWRHPHPDPRRGGAHTAGPRARDAGPTPVRAAAARAPAGRRRPPLAVTRSTVGRPDAPHADTVRGISHDALARRAPWPRPADAETGPLTRGGSTSRPRRRPGPTPRLRS